MRPPKAVRKEKLLAAAQADVEIASQVARCFLFGLIGEEDRDISGYCSAEIARVRTGGNFATGFVSAVTLGIYTPRKVYVTCAERAASASASNGEDLAP